MTYSLGQAEFVLRADTQPLIADQAKAYKQVVTQAQDVTKQLAQQNNVRVSDVRAATSIISDEERKLVRLQEQEAKKAAAARKKYIQDSIKNEVAELRKAEADRKAIARRINNEEKAIERERIAEVKKQLSIEATLRRQAAQQRREEAQKARQEQIETQKSGVLGTGVSGARIGATTATLLGFGAIASGAVLLRAAIVSVTEATINYDQAQRSLNASFGKTRDVYAQLGKDYAKQFNLITTEVQKSIAQFGTLNRQSNLTSQEIKSLIPIAVDLQAAYGGDLQEAFRSVQGAILGETEALEKYGIVLQDGVLKTLPQLTEAEKKNFETLSESEKQLIRYRVLLDLAKESQGAAAERTETLEGAFNKLKEAGNELAKSIGDKTSPIFAPLVAGAADAINKIRELLAVDAEFKKAIDDLKAQQGSPEGLPATTFSGYNDSRVQAQVELNRRHEQIIKDTKALENARKEAIQDAQKEENKRVDAENANLQRRADAEISALKDAAERRVRDLDKQKEQAEAALAIQLRNIETAKDAELERLRTIEEARREASDKELRRLEVEKDKAIRTAEDKRDAELNAIRVQKDAAEDAANEQIRRLEINRDSLLKRVEVDKDNQTRLLEHQKDERDKIRLQEDRAIEDSITKEKRLREEAHKQRLDQLKEEEQALQDKYDDEIARIDKQIDAEDDRHDKRVRNIQKEGDEVEDYYTKQIQLIDDQLYALQEIERVENNRRRLRDLEQRRAGAQKDLTLAQGIGTPEEIQQATDALTRALKLGDPAYIKKREEELALIAGHGIQAIADAQEKLSEVQQDIQDELTDQEVDNNKQRLQDTKRTLQQQQEEHKKTIDAQINKEREAEDDRNKRRKRQLDEDKKAAAEKLEDAKRKIDEQQKKENDAYEKDKDRIDDSVKRNARALDDRRTAEDEKYKNDLERIKNTADAEIEAIKATYDDEQTGAIPAIKRAIDFAKQQYEERTRAVQEAYKDERQQIEETYSNPETGLISVHKQVEESARKAYQNATIAATNHFNDLKQKANDAYRNPDGVSGIIDRLEHLKQDTQNKLKDDLDEWTKWKDGLVGPNGTITKTWAEALKGFDKLLDDIKKRGGVRISPRVVVDVNTGPAQGNGGLQIGPDPGLPGSTTTSGNGAGSTVLPAPTGNSGPQIPDSQTVNDVDVSAGRFYTTFGYAQPYNGQYKAGPGWNGGAAWPNGPSHHKGIDLGVRNSANRGLGEPVGSFTDGTVIATHRYSGDPDKDPGGNYVVIGKGGQTYWYLHLGSIRVSTGDAVKRGSLIGTLGESGTEGAPHLHFEVRNGFNNGPRTLSELENDGIDPQPYINGRDAGYLFRNPTLYQDTVTGERGIMAEKYPERLLGSADTRKFDALNMLTTGNFNSRTLDYAALGNLLSNITASTTSNSGDTLTYYGIAPENLLNQWDARQRKKRVLRGRINV